MQISFAKKFAKQFDKADKKIQQAVNQRLKLFAKVPYDPILNNHALSGKYLGLRSINITGDWRALYEEHSPETRDRIIVFEILGTHSQLYG